MSNKIADEVVWQSTQGTFLEKRDTSIFTNPSSGLKPALIKKKTPATPVWYPAPDDQNVKKILDVQKNRGFFQSHPWKSEEDVDEKIANFSDRMVLFTAPYSFQVPITEETDPTFIPTLRASEAWMAKNGQQVKDLKNEIYTELFPCDAEGNAIVPPKKDDEEVIVPSKRFCC